MSVAADVEQVVISQDCALSDVEERVLAALSRSPCGLFRAASVARVAGVDEDAAGEALRRLKAVGLATALSEVVETHPARRETVWRLGTTQEWNRVADTVRAVRLPSTWPPLPADRLPERFRYLFWWGDPSSVSLPGDAAFVAEQILRSPDIGAWGWALGALPVEALEQVANRDTTPAPLRAMIHNAVRRRRGESR